jgi:hypothetical protein
MKRPASPITEGVTVGGDLPEFYDILKALFPTPAWTSR